MIALALASAVMHLAALAEEDRVHLVVIGDERAALCPNESELASLVRARIGSEPFRDDDDGRGRQLRVGIKRKGRDVEARVAMFGPKGARLGARTLRGPLDCERVTDDLVLAVAIAIDPLLLVRGRPPAAPPPEPPVDEAVVVVPQAAPPPADPGFSLSLPAPASLGLRGLISVSAGVGLIAVPSARGEFSLDYGALDLDAGVRLDLPARYPVAGDSNVALDISLIALQLSPCVGWDIDVVVALRGCAVTEVGALQAQSADSRALPPTTTPWLAVGARAGIDVMLVPEIGVVFEGDVLAPLIRPVFVDAVNAEEYLQPDVVVWTLGIGLALEIR